MAGLPTKQKYQDTVSTKENILNLICPFAQILVNPLKANLYPHHAKLLDQVRAENPFTDNNKLLTLVRQRAAEIDEQKIEEIRARAAKQLKTAKEKEPYRMR